MSNFEYCIGFLLPKKLNRSCEGFAKEIEENFHDFQNKLSERPAHIKVKSPFTATKSELVKLFDLLDRFAKKQEPIELMFDEILFFDKNKLALSVTASEADQLHEMKINLCLLLSAVFPERISDETEPIFIPRVTLGFHKKDHQFINFCEKSFERFDLSDFFVQEIVLFEREAKKKGAQWKPKVNFKLKKKVPAVM